MWTPLVRSCDSPSIPRRWNSFDVTGERSDERHLEHVIGGG
jgi:hypothetical protein